jgi:PhnB protein
MTLTTYLNYGGNCEEALRFYEKNLGGKILMMMRLGESPAAGQFPPEMGNKIVHARIEIGGSVLMVSDTPPERFKPMRSAYLSLGCASSEEAERVHKLLADGGEIFMPLQETFFASRFSMLRDKFGTSWMIIHEKPMQ